MRFRCCCLSTFAAAAALSSPPALPSQIAYEGFGPSFPVYANSGTGFSGAWLQGGSSVLASRYVPSPNTLCFQRLPNSGGSISAPAAQEINGALRALAQPLGADNTTAYLSFLLRPQGKLSEGFLNGFFGMTLNGTAGHDLFIGKSGGGTMRQYILENRGGAGQVSSGAEIVVGRTALLVVKAQFMPGNDVFTLIVNPRPGVSEPAGGAMKTDLDVGTVSQIGIYSTGAFSVDEIRIGTTFADVVPGGDHASHDDRWDDESHGCNEDR